MLAFVRYAPQDSALVRVTDPDAWISPEVQMLREVLHALQVLQWHNTEGARKNPPQGAPERLPITAEEIQAYKDSLPPVLDSLPLDKMREWLGWSERTTA